MIDNQRLSPYGVANSGDKNMFEHSNHLIDSKYLRPRGAANSGKRNIFDIHAISKFESFI